MMNRKRYYNSFFDQINEYKTHGKKEHHGHDTWFDHHILGAGLVASLAIVSVFGGSYLVNNPTVIRNSSQSSIIKTETRPAIDYFEQLSDADDSFASQSDGFSVRPYGDTYVSANNATNNFARSVQLFSGGAARQRAFLRFDLRNLVERGDLVLKLSPVAAYSGSIQVHLLPENQLWEEDALTFESAPESGRVIGRASGSFGTGSTIDIDLRNALEEAEVATLVISASNTGEGFSFYSAESDMPPELISF